MFLAHLLLQRGVPCVVVERRNRDYVESRVRAGVLEPITVELIERLGLGARMRREGLVHSGANVAWDGQLFRIDLAGLTGGSTMMVYGQQEVMKDLFDASAERGLEIVWGAEDVALHDITSKRPFVTWRKDGREQRLDCDFIAGCDGFHGACRQAIPPDVLKTFERVYPFGWLGVLADVPPCGHELIYSNHERGFALASMRSPIRSRYYVQCALGDRVEDWPDERFWDEVCLRLGSDAGDRVVRGPSFEKSIAPLRSSVTEPMSYGCMFLCGDAAHIVPPTGAKGLNLAVSDVIMLSEALFEFYEQRSHGALDRYSERALARVWKAERFSWWLTGITHTFPHMDGFDRRMQLAELAYIRSSRAGQLMLAENYVGLPLQ
jgi:p-hydroxybenzoate 3-monooxygenase